jgi:hypothetical protein
MTTHRGVSWKVFLILWAGTVVGVLGVIPYTLTLQAPLLKDLPVPLTVLLPIQVIQNAVLFAAITAGGLFVASRVGMGAPILEAYLIGEKVEARLKAIAFPSMILGAAAACSIILLDVAIFMPAINAELGERARALASADIRPPAWQGFLASFYGGINEEITMRLLVFSFLAFIGRFISRTAEGRPTLAVLWMANLLTAILFGLGHLPSTAVLVPLTPLVVTRAIVLNGLAGVAFGYLYWTRGLEAAMLSHFSADIVLHGIAAL